MHTSKYIFTLFILFYSTVSVNATEHLVGPTQTYVSPNALYLADIVENGDSICIDAGEYVGTAALAVWSADNLHIRGVGTHLKAEGENILGKGIWVLAGNNITVENIEFSGAIVPDNNGAGIRLDGIGMTLRYCYFHDNENGILTSNPGEGLVSISKCEFGNNGYGDGFTHNVYVGHVGFLSFHYNYSHHADTGHLLKSRAEHNTIRYNRFSDETTGNSSRLIDLPNGGHASVVGNIFHQGENALNNNILGYGKEGLTPDIPHNLYCGNNTFHNERTASCLFVDFVDGTDSVFLSNNIFTGGGIIYNGSADFLMIENVVEEDPAELLFTDVENYDYSLSEDSPAIDAAYTNPDATAFLLPKFYYEHPLNFAQRFIINNAVDAGAYEYGELSSIEDFEEDIIVFPNPTTGIVHLPNLIDMDILQIFDINGKVYQHTGSGNIVDLSELPIGIYFLIVRRENIKSFTKIIKLASD